MKKTLALAMMVMTILSLTACGGSSETENRVVNVCSWGEYIDEDLIYQFEDETGIKVNYQTAESNEALYSLLKTGAGDYDVIVPSDYMIARLIEEGMLEELNYDNIPNYAKIDEQYGRGDHQLGRHVRRKVRRAGPDDPQLPGRSGRRPAGPGL